MAKVDVLAVVSLSDATFDQRIAFTMAMLDRKWRATDDCPGAFQSEFPLDDDDEIVDRSERDIEACASAGGIEGWDAVCLLHS